MDRASPPRSRAWSRPSETDAFMAAWSEPFFQTPWQGAARDLSARESPARSARRGVVAPPEPRAMILYVMPEASVPAVAELTITPAPRALRRVMVVRQELPLP